MRYCGRRGLLGGFVLISVGIVFLLRNLGIIDANLFELWWPLLLILFGVYLLVRRGRGWWQ